MKNSAAPLLLLVLLFFLGNAILLAQSDLSRPYNKHTAQLRSTDLIFGNSIQLNDSFGFIGSENEHRDSSGIVSKPFSGAVYCYSIREQQLKFIQFIQPENRIQNARFGHAISFYKDWLAISAYEEAVAGESKVGAVYVFKKSGNKWLEVQRLTSPFPATNLRFGASIALSDSFLFVGAPYDNTDSNNLNPFLWTGSVHVFKLSPSNTWEWQRKICPSNRSSQTTFFGSQIALNDSLCFVSSHSINYQGSEIGSNTRIYLYKKNQTNIWEEYDSIKPPYALTGTYQTRFGQSIAFNGNELLVGSHTDLNPDDSLAGPVGLAYLYTLKNNKWTLSQTFKSPHPGLNDQFGYKVAIQKDQIAISAPLDDTNWQDSLLLNNTGAVFLFNREFPNLNYSYLKKLVATDRKEGFSESDRFGTEFALGINRILVQAPFDDQDSSNELYVQNAGSVYEFGKPCSLVDPSISLTFCKGDNEIFFRNKRVSAVPGIYSVVIKPVYGCDSLYYLHLTETTINTGIKQNGTELQVLDTLAKVQWVDCSSGKHLAGETNFHLIAKQSGIYKAILSKGNCKDSSLCYTILLNSIFPNQLEPGVLIYPNPVQNKLTIESPKEEVWTLTNILGTELESGIVEGKSQISFSKYVPGIYFIKLGNRLVKLVKQD